MIDESNPVETKVIDQEPDDDENPLKKKKPFVLTPARAETLKKGREKRMANIKRLQEEKAQKHEDERQKKREVRVQVQQKVEKEMAKKKKVSITVPESDSESSDDDDYEIEIKKKPRPSKEKIHDTKPEIQNFPNILLV